MVSRDAIVAALVRGYRRDEGETVNVIVGRMADEVMRVIERAIEERETYRPRHES